MKSKWGIFVLGLAVVNPIAAQARGVFGGGNSGDELIQWEFIRSTAVAIVQKITHHDLTQVRISEPARELYRVCRPAIFRGLQTTQFRPVDEIPDGGTYHALARRVGNGVMEISRRKLQQLLDAGLIGAPQLIAALIHEAGHDCRIANRPVDDTYDPLLNELGEALVRISNESALASFVDLNLVERVRRGETMRLENFSGAVQAALTARYLDYVSDWIFARHIDELRGFPRPTLGSRFYDTTDVSVFPGWESFDWSQVAADSELRIAVEQILRPSVESFVPRILVEEGRSVVAPSKVDCDFVAEVDGSPAAVSCSWEVSWSPIAQQELSTKSVLLNFTLDIFGHLNFRLIQVR